MMTIEVPSKVRQSLIPFRQQCFALHHKVALLHAAPSDVKCTDHFVWKDGLAWGEKKLDAKGRLK
eukprot:scaffold13468_cov95-Skeletonema_dohrnii-CCMP3373.AAC.2